MTKIDAYTVETTDIESLATFYQVVFSLGDLIWHGTSHAGFKITPYLGFDLVNKVNNGGNSIIWFKVDDISGLEDAIVKLRGTILNSFQVVENELLGTFADPEGNKIGILSDI